MRVFAGSHTSATLTANSLRYVYLIIISIFVIWASTVILGGFHSTGTSHLPPPWLISPLNR